jgi:putative transposase
MRPLRIDFPGALHHVFDRGNGKQTIFLDAEDCRFFLDRLFDLKKETGFKLFSFALMINHFHLLIESGLIPLETVMSRLLTAYAMRFNWKYGRVGHVFQGRHGAKLCGRDAYFMRLIRYINRNPVAGGIVMRPEDWEWSSHRDLAEGRSGLVDCEFPLSFFGSEPSAAQAAYREYVGKGEDDRWEPWMEEPLAAERLERILDVITSVSVEIGVPVEAITSRNRARALAKARRMVARKAVELGHAQTDIAVALNCSDAAVSRMIRLES